MAGVEQTQLSVIRSVEAAGLVGAAIQAADQTQRQGALETQRLARQQALQVGAAAAADEALPVDAGPLKADPRQQLRGRKSTGGGGEKDSEALRDPGPSGRNLDITA